jgi:hypothetical protein
MASVSIRISKFSANDQSREALEAIIISHNKAISRQEKKTPQSQ